MPVAKAKAIECPDCKKTFENGRALAAHTRFHCSGKETSNKPKNPIRNPASSCECKDGGSWELLDPAEHAAIVKKINPKTDKPYRKYCTQCREAY